MVSTLWLPRNYKLATHSSFDSIVIGGGTAGCLVAHDLVLKGHRVLLLEAGIDTPPERVPADIHDVFPASYSNPAYTW
ncbi:MAG: FAD-dependent oxidoreductase, partial [Flavobacteriia bacterium]|nr:FAD-dependent oxidoreductase [Flavobacteriia bacterium]